MPIRIGTAERGGTFHGQGLALKTLLDRDPAVAPVDVVDSPGAASIENANRLHAGEIEFGFMAANWAPRARRGEAPFTTAIDLRMVAPMNAGPLFFVVRADSSLRSVDDLCGRRVAVGLEKSGMAQHAREIFGVLGLSFSEVTPVYLDFAAGAAALVERTVDAQLQCPIPNQVMTELDRRIDIRVLDYAPGQLDAILAAVPYYRRAVMTRGALCGLVADSAQVGVLNVLTTHGRVDDTRVEAVARAILAGAEELGHLDPLFRGLADLFAPLRSDGPAALEPGGVPLHPGALAAYRAAGLIA